MPAPVNPIDAVTYGEAAHIFGVDPSTVRRYVLAGRLTRAEPNRQRRLSRAEVETLARQTYPHRRYTNDPGSYWVTGRRAADLLGVGMSRLNQLAVRGFLPYEVHRDGTRMYRREQLMTVANAREARWR